MWRRCLFDVEHQYFLATLYQFFGQLSTQKTIATSDNVFQVCIPIIIKKTSGLSWQQHLSVLAKNSFA